MPPIRDPINTHDSELFLSSIQMLIGSHLVGTSHGGRALIYPHLQSHQQQTHLTHWMTEQQIRNIADNARRRPPHHQPPSHSSLLGCVLQNKAASGRNNKVSARTTIHYTVEDDQEHRTKNGWDLKTISYMEVRRVAVVFLRGYEYCVIMKQGRRNAVIKGGCEMIMLSNL